MRRTHKRRSELVNSSEVHYDEASNHIVASKEWWSRKFKENKEYKEFKDRDVSEIYIRYCQLFGDSYDGDKYAVIPAKLCRTGFDLYENSALEDNMDAISVDVESSGSSDEAEPTTVGVRTNVSTTTSGSKRKSSDSQQRGRKKKMSARELSQLTVPRALQKR